MLLWFRRHRVWTAVVGSAVATLLGLAFLVSILERREQARHRFVKVVEVAPFEPDPSIWGRNFPRQYGSYLKTMTTPEMVRYSKYGRYGGSEAFSKLEMHPDYRRLFAGYSFAVEYREERGHMRALEDVVSTPRLGDAKPGTCMACKSSHVPSLLNEMGPAAFYGTPMKQLIAERGVVHPVSCADCHDAETMDLKITRPAFAEAMARRGVDLNRASRQEMRTFVCAQCHVEYYFTKPGNVLTFPWDRGLRADEIEDYYSSKGYSDWTHGETGAPMIKIQHPEFELWSTGVHARAGISCSDCHMPYLREGALKITDHWIRTPLANLSNACLPCHRQTETEMRERVLEIQDRTYHLLGRAERAILSAMDAVVEARKAGDAVPEEALQLLRRAQLRWDFVSAENSMGFHSPQEAARVLGDAIDLARQAEISVLKAGGRRSGR